MYLRRTPTKRQRELSRREFLIRMAGTAAGVAALASIGPAQGRRVELPGMAWLTRYRPRPPAAPRAGGVAAQGIGYPSLSTTIAAAGFGLIAALACTQLRRLGARAAIGSGAVMAAFIHLARIGCLWQSRVRRCQWLSLSQVTSRRTDVSQANPDEASA